MDFTVEKIKLQKMCKFIFRLTKTTLGSLYVVNYMVCLSFKLFERVVCPLQQIWKKSSQNTHLYCRLWITRVSSKTVKAFKTVHQRICEKMTNTKEINLKMHFSQRLQGWQTCWYYLFLIHRRILFYYPINLLNHTMILVIQLTIY